MNKGYLCVDNQVHDVLIGDSAFHISTILFNK